jgi:ribonuclease D
VEQPTGVGEPASQVPFVDSAAALDPIPAVVAPHERLAVDTEADSLHCYFEKLCLIQLSIPGNDWLIDPLAGYSLEPLFGAFDGTELIFHGSDYDLRLLRRVGFKGPTRIFDTMIAARLCGVAEFSLAALLKRHFDIEVPKTSQKANWAKRPLSPAMLAYAVNDTRYLHRLAEIYEGQLRTLGRWTWFEQSCDRAIKVTETSKERDEEEVWRVSGSGKLRGRAAAILRELWRWRDQEARNVDRPSFHILHNHQLIQAATELDAGRPVRFDHLRGGRARRFEEAAERATNLPQSEWPVFVRNSRPRPSRADEDRMQEIKVKRDRIAAGLNLDPSLIAPKAAIEGMVLRPEEANEKLLPWQRELLNSA